MAETVFLSCVILLGLLYNFPIIVAFTRRHPQRWAITVVNNFLAWTALGWIVALAWAVTAKRKELAHG